MKTNVLHLSSFPIAVAAFVIAPINPVAASLVVTVAGVFSVLVLDYGRPAMPISAPAQVIPFGSASHALVESTKAA